MANEVATIETRATQLAEKIEVLVTEARQKVASVANTAQVYTYYEIGRYIVEDEQGGKVRAEYGKGVLKRVSERLTERLGKGWSVDTLENARNFYNIYAKSEPVVRKSNPKIARMMLSLNSRCPKTPISMHSNMHSACLTKPCFSKNCVNGLRNIERRTRNERNDR